MRRLSRLIFSMSLFVACGVGAIAPMDFDSPEQRERFQKLVAELRCMVCQNESLADSDALLAQDMRDEILTMLKDGHSDDEIRDFLVQRYGDFVLYRPPMKPTTWLLWFGPLLLLAAGGVTLAVVIRRRSASGNQTDSGDSQ